MNQALFREVRKAGKTSVLFLVPARAMIWGLDLLVDFSFSSSRKARP